MSEFERAADAVVCGDATALRALLGEVPELAGERSAREHRATLLHYVAANGVEEWRQRTPANVVEIATMLLDAGASVDAVAKMYGQNTTLELAATSIHPQRAGVLTPLLELLLGRGASVEGATEGSRPLNACLANGRKLSAEFLAKRGAQLDLEGAAGVGRLDVVKSFFDAEGALKASATQGQMESGFIWACEYGRTEVADVLLERGVDKGTYRQSKLTGLHWAAASGDVETVEVLLRHEVPLEAKNIWGGTPLGSAVWAATRAGADETEGTKPDWIGVIALLVAAGADVNAVGRPSGDARIDYALATRRRGEEKA